MLFVVLDLALNPASELICKPQLGRLNLLTRRRVAEAAKLIETGERTCMK